MYPRDGRKVTLEDMQRVRIMIEQCLVAYKTKKEVIDILYQNEMIEPGFTKSVWKELEEQNQEFFKAYYTRLILIDQITKFNSLVEKQAAIMNQFNPSNEVVFPTESCIPPISTYSGVQSAYETSTFEHPFNMLLAQNPNFGMIQGMNNGFDDCGHMELQHDFDYPFNSLLAQNPNAEMIPGMNNGMIPVTHPFPADLPPSGFINCGPSGMQHASAHPLLAQNPDVGMISGINNGIIPFNNNTTLGIYQHQLGTSGVRFQASPDYLSIHPSSPPFSDPPYSPGDQHSHNG